MTFPEDLRYTSEHEWIRQEAGGLATVGVTDFAQSELGDIVFVELDADADGTAEDTFGTVEAVKTVSDLYFPVAGEVVEVNEALDGSPDLVNRDPYGEGWMIRMRVADEGELGNLMTAAEYADMVGA